jgi:hypothetical protein
MTAALCSLAIVGTVVAQSASGYDLSWRVFAGGGTAKSAGDTYIVTSAMGQTFTARSTGGAYAMDSGFFGGGLAGKTKRVLPQLSSDGSY